jgi:phage shock protein PspC (stress-responsive transcriptional regulator)
MRAIQAGNDLKELAGELLRRLFEYHLFGVCAYLGEKLGLASSKIRLFFVYSTLLTFGSPVIFYLIFAFWLDLVHYIRHKKRNPLRDF